jgi:single-strand DNA-binding protein
MIITGLARLGRDAETRYTPSGEAVCNLALAFSYGQKDASGKRPTQWVNASIWGKRAESLAQFLTKGTAVAVVLSDPHLESYQGKNGAGTSLVARVIDLEFAGGKRENAAPTERAAHAPDDGATPAAHGTAIDDDIPF